MAILGYTVGLLSEAGLSSDVIVVLVSPRNPLNIGAAARALSNFGVTELRLVTPYREAFEEARSGVGATPILERAREFGTLAEAVADAHWVVGTSSVGPREAPLPLYRLEDGVRRARKRGGRLAVLFGSEKFGLSNEDYTHCHALWRIPARAEHGSMNLGQSVAVVLYELARAGGWNAGATKGGGSRAGQNLAGPDLAGHNLAEQAAVERVVESLLRVCGESGFLHPPVTAGTERKLKHLVRRMHLRQLDAVTLQGILRQILWKFKNPS